jgi:Cu+-exporting ATPase
MAAIPAKAKALKLQISGMDCEACTLTIKKNIEEIKGVYSANIDFNGGTALVETDGQVNPQDIVKAVAKAGYAASVKQ